MSGYFITATGTGVGKTFTTCALIHAARVVGREVQAYKPVISGYDAADVQSDTALIAAALDVPPSAGGGRLGGRSAILPTNVDKEESAPPPQPSPACEGGSISPWRFAAPVSPHQAAAREGSEIVFEELVAWSRARAAQDGLTLIEGVGGVMVPLTDRHTVLDWMVALKLPVVLVAGSYLGTISHTLTALAVMRAAGLHVAALVVNASEGSTVTLRETEEGLDPFIRDIPLRIFQPRVSSPQQAVAIHAMVERL